MSALQRALVAAILLSAGIAHSATTLTVTTASMTVAADGDCSLPEAFVAANSNTTVNECVVGGGGAPFTINLAPGTYVATTFSVDPAFGPTFAVVTTDIEI